MERGATRALRGAIRWVFGANANLSPTHGLGKSRIHLSTVPTRQNRTAPNAKASAAANAKANAAANAEANAAANAEAPPEAPSMISGVISMVLGAGGAILVAGIGCMAVFQMVLSVSEQAGRIKRIKYEPDD